MFVRVCSGILSLIAALSVAVSLYFFMSSFYLHKRSHAGRRLSFTRERFASDSELLSCAYRVVGMSNLTMCDKGTNGSFFLVGTYQQLVACICGWAACGVGVHALCMQRHAKGLVEANISIGRCTPLAYVLHEQLRDVFTFHEDVLCG